MILKSTTDCPAFPDIAGKEFRHCVDYIGYAVDSDGGLWSCRGSKPWKELRTTKNYLGYLQQKIPKNDEKQKSTKVHQLVCTAFHGPCPQGMETRHKNGIRDDNHADNLEWGTHADNIRDAVKHGNWRHFGEKNPHCKLTDTQVTLIRETYATHPCPATYKKLAATFGVAWGHIYKVVRGTERPALR